MKHTQNRSSEKSHSQSRRNSAPVEVSDDMMSEIDQNMKADEMPSEEMDSAQTESSAETAQAAGAETSPKSVGSLISESLAKESQATIDESLAKLSSSYKEAKKYVSESPAEAALIACSAGLAAWVLLGTKPGRKVFDAAAVRFVPEITSWASKTFKSALN